MSDFSNTSPAPNDSDYFGFDPGPEAATKAGTRDFSVPIGWYPMTVSSFEKTTSKSGNAMFKVAYTDHTGVTKSKYPFLQYQVISDKNLHIVGNFLANLGCQKNDKGVYQVSPSAIIGKQVEVYLTPDVYEGTTRSKPDKIRPLGKGTF